MRTSERQASQSSAATGSGQKNGFSSTASQSQRARSIACGAHLHQRAADARSAPSTLRATAPAATRIAVSRAEERPPPR